MAATIARAGMRRCSTTFRHALRLGTSLAALALAAPAMAQDAQDIVDVSTFELDPITVVASRTEQEVTDTLASVSVVRQEQIDWLQPERLQDIFWNMPSVWFNTNADDLATGFNIRGLQDYGRVAVILDGARQNFQQSGHGPQGQVFVDPDMLAGADVVRGPVANIYGSGAIGGVVAMRTKDSFDILQPGEQYAVQASGFAGSNTDNYQGSAFFAGRPNENVDFVFGGSARTAGDYEDGNGNTVLNSGQDVNNQLAKLTFRPADGHELKFGVVNLNGQFDSGQGTDNSEGLYGNNVRNTTVTGTYSFERPDVPLIDFEVTTYWNQTEQEMVVKEQYAPICTPYFCMDFTGPVGTLTNYTIDTIGFDANNSSRFEKFGLNHTVTIGGDYFRDDVETWSTYEAPDAGVNLTPSGNREVGGAFVQWLAEYGTWLDVVAALRYDSYNLSSPDGGSDGDHLSPKITVGITPLEGFTVYGTFAEGYRAPAISEALVSGFHPGNIFLFIPNPDLQAETGKTYEAGVNLRYDNLFRDGDKFRAKAAIFQNDVSDYIDLENVTGIPACTYYVCYQYVNVTEATIKGVEVEGTYDAGRWFVSASGSYMDSENEETGERLNSVPPGVVSGTLGARFLNNKLLAAIRYQHVWGASENPATEEPAEAYDLLGLTIAYEINKNVTASLIADNLLDEQYTPYLQNLPSPGLSIKGALKVRFGYVPPADLPGKMVVK